MSSPLLQSPFSCTCKPCSAFGLRPLIWPLTRTTSPLWLKLRRPLTLLPRVGCRSATARGPGGALAQPARARATTAPPQRRARRERVVGVMRVLLGAGGPKVAQSVHQRGQGVPLNRFSAPAGQAGANPLQAERRLSRAYSPMAPKVAVPMPPRPKSPNFSVKSPVPRIRVTAATIRFLLSEKSTLLSTQILAPATAIRPNTTIDTPPITGSGIAWITAPNLGLKPSTTASTAAQANTAVE